MFICTLYCCMQPGCVKAYSTKFNLKRHIETYHQKKKRHQCTICNNWFASKQNLIEHVFTHTGDKPFICSICKKAFRQNSQLTLHKRRHEYAKDEAPNEKANAPNEKANMPLSTLSQKRGEKSILDLKEIQRLDFTDEEFEIKLPPIKPEHVAP
jgi:uncharacterized Zn-finger protein